VSKLDAGAVDVSWQVVDVNALLREVYEAFLPLAQENGLEMSCSSAEDRILFARTDTALLRRVLQNLVGNAIKFTQSGSIALEVAPAGGTAGGEVVVRVRDTGPGIPPEAHEQVFEEFFQVGNPQRDRSHGLGLGLSIVQRIVRLIGAKVVLHSVPGQGSTFEVHLPGAPDSMTPAATRVRLTELPAPAVGRVLVVDDEPDIRISLATLLGTLGWTALCVGGREEALRAWREGFDPDAIVLDFRLHAGESGLDTLRDLRHQGCAAPAILITGDTEPRRIAAARASNIPVIYKPVDGMVLVGELQNAIARHGRKVPVDLPVR
jgi:CheY-like chemotaxis protein